MSFRPGSHRPETLKRRDALLDAAIAIIGEGGLGALTHRSVASRAELPNATTSYFFASIDDLAVAAMERVVSKASEQLAQIGRGIERLDTGTDPDRVIADALDFLFAETDSETITQFECYLLAARRPELQAQVGEMIGTFAGIVERGLTAMGVPDARPKAQGIVALVDGFALHRLAHGRSASHDQALRTTIAMLIAAPAAG